MDKIERVRGRPSIDVRGKDLIFARDDTAVMDRNINANDNKAYGNVPVALAASRYRGGGRPGNRIAPLELGKRE